MGARSHSVSVWYLSLTGGETTSGSCPVLSKNWIAGAELKLSASAGRAEAGAVPAGRNASVSLTANGAAAGVQGREARAGGASAVETSIAASRAGRPSVGR